MGPNRFSEPYRTLNERESGCSMSTNPEDDLDFEDADTDDEDDDEEDIEDDLD